MKKKFLNFVFAFCLTLSLAFLLTACGGNTDDDDQPKSYTVSVTVDGQGQVEGTGSYEEGSTVILTPVAEEGYAFYKWSDGEKSAERYINFIYENYNLTAYFKKCTIYTVSNRVAIKAFGENTIIEKYGSSSNSYSLKSAIISDNNEYLIQGDWYSVNYGELSAEPVSNYSYLNLSNTSSTSFEFVPKHTTDYIFVRYPRGLTSPLRVGTYSEVTASSDRVWTIIANSTLSKTQNEYSFYNYSISTNLDNANPNEEMYIYVKYVTETGTEYRYVANFYTSTYTGSMTREFYYALSGDRLLNITVKHS